MGQSGARHTTAVWTQQCNQVWTVAAVTDRVTDK